MGHAGGLVVGQQQRRAGGAGARANSRARSGAPACTSTHVAAAARHRRTRCRKCARRAARCRRSAAAGRAPPGTRPARDSGSMHWRAGRAAPARAAPATLLGGIDHQRVQRRARPSAVHSRSSSTPPKATCGFETTGTKRTRLRAGEQAAQAVGLVGAARRRGDGSRACAACGSGRAQASAPRRPRRRCAQARRRPGSRRRRRCARPCCRRARSARCTSACADRRCQSSGTRWPLATPTHLELVADQRVERRARA